jgi:protein-tyrosine phosphatase
MDARSLPARPECLVVPLLDDKRPIPEEAVTTARKLARALRKGKRVLVMCVQGRNRSGLVAAMALSYLTKKPGAACADLVSAGRPNALTNASFVLFLNGFNRAK